MDGTIIFLNSHILLANLLTGWLLDIIFGDPSRLPHPVVYMGKWIAMGERRLNRGKSRKLKGALFAVGSVLLVFGVAWLLTAFLRCQAAASGATGMVFSLISYAVVSLCVFFCLAGKTLRREVRMVFGKLELGLDEGRQQVARIVGRDTLSLSRQEVSTAALETLAENLSDGVIAPLFWFALLGVPGMMAYKMINTLDSMIGYQNKRYKDFGCWAARIDDIANYLPARLTALLMILAGWGYMQFSRSHSRRSLAYYLQTTRRYSRCHASPNSGWPEAALSSLLDCRFGGPHDYFGELFYKPYIGSNARAITFSDMTSSLHICLAAEIIAVVAAAAIVV
ncbi:adenosylcobinamide-phosphate synthase CbiB [Prevotella pectinovora]|uniref:adenosylcobinamide-phosphate synthase CbiB n=1 Tax=Prevotella pectinovora TaxID=1602169 RepID=UPI00258ACB13|nr:adenosylcobinamide-phosphate synthase CbiB [uncultured Prevotella sp.]